MIDPVSILTILTALIPTGNYIAKRVTDYWTGGNKPVNIEEEVSRMNAETERLKTIYQGAQVGDTYRWVNAIVALQRPIVVFVVLLNWSLITLGLIHVDLQLYVIVANLASSVMFYLFGDRSLMYSLEAYNKKLLK